MKMSPGPNSLSLENFKAPFRQKAKHDQTWSYNESNMAPTGTHKMGQSIDIS